MKKNIFVLGSKGYTNLYGYFETFVNNLINNYEGNNTKFYVFEKSLTKTNNNDEIRNGVICPKIYGKFLYKIMCLRYIFKSTKDITSKNISRLLFDQGNNGAGLHRGALRGACHSAADDQDQCQQQRQCRAAGLLPNVHSITSASIIPQNP